MQGKIELIKKGLGRIVNEREETPILSLPMEVEEGDIAEVEFDRDKIKRFVAFSPEKYYGVVIGDFQESGGIILVTYPKLLGTIIFNRGEFRKGAKVEFKLKKTFKGIEAINVEFTKEIYKCFLPSFGRIEKRILKPKYGIVEDVIKVEKNIMEGEVKTYGNKGFGFIRSVRGDIFFLGNLFEKVYNKVPEKGDKVFFKFKNSPKGKIVTNFYTTLPQLPKNKQYFILDGRKLPIFVYEKFFKKSPEIGDTIYYLNDKRIVFRKDNNEIERYIFIKDEKGNFETGIVNFINEEKKYGFIKNKRGSFYFTFKQFKNFYKRLPKKGDEVKFFYLESERGFSVSRFLEIEFEIRKNQFNNFIEVDENSYYYAYINLNKVEEVFRYNSENLSMSIACYKEANNNLKKLDAINCMIENNFESKKINKDILIKEKLQILDELIKSLNDEMAFEYEIEYQKIKFEPNRLKKFNFRGINIIENISLKEYKESENRLEFVEFKLKEYRENERELSFEKINTIKEYKEKEEPWKIIEGVRYE